MFALFEDGSTIIMGTAGFAAFGCSTSGYGCSPSSKTLACKQAQEEKRIVPIISIVFKTSASKERKRTEKWSLRSLVISH